MGHLAKKLGHADRQAGRWLGSCTCLKSGPKTMRVGKRPALPRTSGLQPNPSLPCSIVPAADWVDVARTRWHCALLSRYPHRTRRLPVIASGSCSTVNPGATQTHSFTAWSGIDGPVELLRDAPVYRCACCCERSAQPRPTCSDEALYCCPPLNLQIIPDRVTCLLKNQDFPYQG